MNAYKVVEDFEAALAEYTGAPFVVTTNSCSMALLVACSYGAQWHKDELIIIPSRTYCAVPQSIIHAGFRVDFSDTDWRGEYRLYPSIVWDSARRFTSGMYRPGQMQCVSFQTSKILGLEQGGAILLDDPEADQWLRRARFDGRLNASEKLPKQIGWHCYLSPTVAALGLQHLACLPRHNEDQAGSKDFADLSKLDIWT
jgi:dTDP-4-amino-4,6-dideoxygalactose transaminase